MLDLLLADVSGGICILECPLVIIIIIIIIIIEFNYSKIFFQELITDGIIIR